MVNSGRCRYFVSVLIRRISNPSEFSVAFEECRTARGGGGDRNFPFNKKLLNGEITTFFLKSVALES
jgi:hypothetical protein